MKNQTVVVDTGDSRMFYCARALSDMGLRTISKTAYDDKIAATYIFSPAKRFSREELSTLAEGSALLCGSLPTSHIALLDDRGIKHCNLLLDEVYAVENAIQTGEAALMLIIRATNTSIFTQKLFIFGFGRLGKALAKLFSDLGLNFAVCTNDYYERASAHITCNQVYDLNAPLQDADVIVNTIPAKIFGKERIEKATKCCYILDLASFSSLDNMDADSIGIPYDNALGLPGKYSPKSAGEILADAVFAIVQTLE